jgi:hypothetical protein
MMRGLKKDYHKIQTNMLLRLGVGIGHIGPVNRVTD